MQWFDPAGPLALPLAVAVLLGLVIWLMTRRFRFVVYLGATFAAWSSGRWWLILMTMLFCGLVEIGVGLWGLADRAEKRLGKRE